MNAEAIENRINEFFDKVTPDELIKTLEDKGYEFEEIECEPKLKNNETL